MHQRYHPTCAVQQGFPYNTTKIRKEMSEENNRIKDSLILVQMHKHPQKVSDVTGILKFPAKKII